MAKKLPAGFFIDKNGKYGSHVSLGTDPLTGKRLKKKLSGLKRFKELEYKVLQIK